MNKQVVEFRKVSVVQSNGVKILQNVDLNVAEGEFSYVVGKTGSGKSSLLKTIYAELPLAEGTGRVGSFSLLDIEKNEIPMLRRQIGMIFQDFKLLMDRTVRGNLEFTLRATDWKNNAEIEARISHVLESVRLVNVLEKKPHQLSGGEQQRVVIARALLNNPKLILADEPTGNLDPDISDDIMSLLLNISEKGTAVLMATHDYRLINKFPGSVYKLEKGEVNKSGLFS
jgi:cell division transport system ATP-binding protein